MRKILGVLTLSIGLLGCAEKAQKPIPTAITPVLLDSVYLASKTKYFSIKNDTLQGVAAEIWEQILDDSQFVVFGERHNSLRTSELISALVPTLHKSTYHDIAFEVGPHSAQKLRELSLRSEQTVNALKLFNDKYYNKAFEMEAIPFFYGVADAEFLKKISAYKIHFWGVDQEFYYAAHFLNDELLKLAAGKSAYGQIRSNKRKLDQRLNYWFEKAENEEGISVFSELLKEKCLQDFFAVFNEKDVKAKSIIHDLKLSWDIYDRWRSGSHADRVSYMRNQFMDNYEHASTSRKNPKVFVKIGQAHAAQIISNGAYDIGYLCEEIAQNNGTNCTNINTWTSYYLENDTLSNVLEAYDYYKRLQHFTCFADKEKWAIIDLVSVRKDVNEGRLLLPQNGDYHAIKRLIEAYDYQLIMPVDQTPKANRSLVVN